MYPLPDISAIFPPPDVSWAMALWKFQHFWFDFLAVWNGYSADMFYHRRSFRFGRFFTEHGRPTMATLIDESIARRLLKAAIRRSADSQLIGKVAEVVAHANQTIHRKRRENQVKTVGLIKVWTYQALDISGSGHIWPRTYRAVDTSGHGHIGQWTHRAMDISGHGHIWPWTYLDMDISGHGHIWPWSYRVMDISGIRHIRPWTYRVVDTSVTGHIGS